MTFGLRNAGQTFQRFIDDVTHGLNFCFPYVVDNILVFSKSPEEHAKHLRALFQRLSTYGVIVNPSKCVLGQPEVRFLGYLVSAQGTRPPSDRVAALREYSPPTTASLINFYRQFHIPPNTRHRYITC